MLALLRYHYRCDPLQWITEDAAGQLDFTEFAEYWAALEWCQHAERQQLPRA